MDRKYEILKNYFGYSSLKPGQEEIIDNITAGHDCMAVMPTGAGKSLCFQIPALMMEGITIVISPLISLMKDQVTNLVQSGVRAAYLNSSLTYPQYKKALANAMDGMYKIIYIAPERLLTEDILTLASSVRVSMVAVDEAHCVSQWGHDFRPQYKSIAEFIDKMYKRPVVCAFTATATNEVKADIIKLLKLRSPFMITTGYDRENLYFEVRKPNNKFSELVKLLVGFGSKSGIIYCLTRKKTDELYEKLSEKGFSVSKYHAGLTDEERRKNQEDFLFGRVQIMTATNAFGMGIDKSDVSFVIHYNMPGDMESYYQEAGRAGRDGSPAKCILLFSSGDIASNKYLIENNDVQNVDEQTKKLLAQRANERLYKMTSYCSTTMCLRQFILEYFGERAGGRCENCGNCLGEFEDKDVTETALKLLRCIRGTGERFGKAMTVMTAKGIINVRTQDSFVRRLDVFGILAAEPQSHISLVLDELTAQNYVAASEGDYPTLYLTARAEELIAGRERLILRVAKTKTDKAASKAAEGVDPELYEALRSERARLARMQGVPAFVIFSDASLADMCRRMPRTNEEFLEVNGVGYTKMQNYAVYFLRIINGNR